MKVFTTLKTYLDYRDISQRELAKRLDVDQAIVSTWAKGKSLPPIETREEIGKILDTDIVKLWPIT